MSDDLTTMLLDSLDKEARRFAGEHPGEETGLYERAIVPRRRIRRLAQAAGGLAAAGLVGVAAYAFAVPHDQVAPAHTSPTPTPSPSVTATADSGAAWDPPGVLDPQAAVTPLTAYWGISEAAVPGCVAFDGLARLEGLERLGGAPSPLGAIDDGNGGTHGVAARTFASSDDAQEFLAQATVAAEQCQTEGAALDLAVDLAEVGIQNVVGEGLRVGFTHPSDTFGNGYSIWIHVQGAEAFSVAAEAPADRLAAQIIVAWFTAEGR